MTHSPWTFADRIINIAATGNLVRVEFGAVAVAQSAAPGAEPQAALTLVMPLEGFLQSFVTQEALLDQLVRDGVVRRPPPPSHASGSTAH